ncbi:hypothetical protein N9L02_01815, partial [Gammaproteobacteria bacterium]|nr:hypothetical protein [Gammaproteobacteria bacterium]
MKNIIKSMILLIFMLAFTGCKEDNNTKVSIIIPLAHTAMNEIVSGFSDTINQKYSKPITIKIKNAQNDLNLQRSITQQLAANKDEIIITIGLAATQMARTIIHNKPILGLAAKIDNKNIKKGNLALVHDEIPPENLIKFINKSLPNLKHITLIHSSADKVFPDVKKAINYAKNLGVTINPIMAQTLPDLTSVARSISNKTQAIIVLKDNLIVSGIGVLAKAAKTKNIPLLTLDQGSVENGAGIALAVHEKE